jgi:hypothetical protein
MLAHIIVSPFPAFIFDFGDQEHCGSMEKCDKMIRPSVLPTWVRRRGCRPRQRNSLARTARHDVGPKLPDSLSANLFQHEMNFRMFR